MNKAIQYREDGKFYGLVNVPEQPKTDDDFEGCGGSPMENIYERYDFDVRACIAAGKEIINPEAIEYKCHQGKKYAILRKAGDIFDCPENIEFEEICNADCPDINFGAPCCHPSECISVIRLKLKQEVKSLNNGIFTIITNPDSASGKFGRSVPKSYKNIIRDGKEESQDDLLGEIMNIIVGHLEWEDGEIAGLDPIGAEAELKSKFIITRKK